MLRLKVFDGQEKINETLLGADVVTLGRDETNGVMLPDLSVSRAHAQIEPTGNFHVIRDTGSTNGTFVNDILARVHVLSAGDTIRLGKYLLRVESMGSRTGDTTRVRVEELRLAEEAFELVSEDDSTTETAPAEEEDAAPALDSLRRLYELQRQLGQIDTVPALLERTLKSTLEELDAHSGSVLLVEGSPINAQSAPEATRASERFKPAAVDWCANESADEEADNDSGEEQDVDPGSEDVEDDELVVPREIIAQVVLHKAGLTGQRPGAGRKAPFAVCPLLDHRGVRGLLFVERQPNADTFSTLELRFLRAVADQLVTGLANATLFEKVGRQNAKVEAIVSNLDDGVIVVDEYHRVVEANASALTLLCSQENNPVGRSLFELFERFHVSPEPSVLAVSALQQGAFFYLRPRENGETTTPAGLVSGRLIPFPKDTEQPHGVVVTLRDRSREQHVEELKVEFLEKVAHKLRSPLTVIQGNLSLLESEEALPEVPAVRDSLAEIQRSTQLLAALVGDFVDFMELRTRTNPLIALPRQTALPPLVRDVLNRIRETAECRNIRLEERLGDDLPKLTVQPELVARAVTEVIANAIKFGSEGGVVTIEAETTGGYLRLDVIDDGPGIPGNKLDSVFFVCHQVDREQTGQVPGAGLGLTIAREIVQEHGGEVQVCSPVTGNGGTRVSLFLPLEPASATEEPATNDTSHDSPPAKVVSSSSGDSLENEAADGPHSGLELETEKETTS